MYIGSQRWKGRSLLPTWKMSRPVFTSVSAHSLALDIDSSKQRYDLCLYLSVPGNVVTLRTDRLVEGDDGPGLEEGDQGGLVGGKLLVSGDLEDVTDIDSWRGSLQGDSACSDHVEEVWDEIGTEMDC